MKGFLTLLFFAIPFLLTAKEDNIRRVDCSSFIQNSAKKKSDATLGITQPHRVLTINTGDAHKTFFNATDYLILDNFPVNEVSTSTLHLRRKTTTVIEPNTLWHLGNGKTVATPPVQFYTGFDEKDPKSKVFIMYGNGELIGSIRSSNGTVRTISPQWENAETKGEHLLAVTDGLETLKGFQCHNDLLNSETVSDENRKPAALEVPTFGDMLEVEVAFEIDYPVYLKIRKANMTEEQNIANTILYVVSLLAQSSTMYEDEINVTLKFAPDPHIWLSEDDGGYPGYQDEDVKIDAGKILDRFTNRRKNQSDPRDLAHLVTSVTGSGNLFAAGVAWATPQGSDPYLGTLCNKNWGYGISSINVNVNWPTLNYIWDAMVCTHEMGHNFGGPHTHYCKSDSPWPDKKPLDTCVVAQGSQAIGDGCNLESNKRTCPEGGGTIMSYCHLLSGCGMRLEFTPVVANQLRKAADRAKSSCVSVPGAPSIKLQFPLGRNTFRGNEYDTIRFFAQNVTTVRAEYSLDNKATWHEIKGDVPAAQRRIAWKMPNESTTVGYVRVMDANSPQVGDTSWVAFSIVAPTLKLETNIDGKVFGQRETIVVLWKQSLLTEVIVEYSTDGGSEWKNLKNVQTNQSATSGNYEWIPGKDILGNTIRVRVRSTDNSLISSTGNFTIGKEKLYLIEPTGGETLCAGKAFSLAWWGENFGSDNTTLRIDYTLDDGKTWTRLSGTSSKVLQGSRNWTVPSSVTTSALGRIRMMFLVDADTVTQVTSQPITFSNDPNCVVASIDDLQKDIRILTLTPNPAKDVVHCTFSLINHLKDLSIDLFDVSGRFVKELYKNDNGLSGSISFHTSVSDLTSGTYQVILRSGDRTFSVPLIISR